MWWAALFSGENGKMIRNIVIISLVLTVLAIVTVVLVQKNKKSAKDARNQAIIAEYEKEIIPSSLSYAESEYDTMATTIWDSHTGIFGDDNEEAVYETFMRMKTNSDVLKLQAAFGIKGDKDLFQYIRHFLSSEEIDKVNSILAQRNISIKL